MIKPSGELRRECLNFKTQLTACAQLIGEQCVVCRAADRIEELEAEVAVLMDGMEMAWGIIANAYDGDWTKGSGHWVKVATRWRDDHWHQALARNKSALNEETE